jgi:hypothetical protein
MTPQHPKLPQIDDTETWAKLNDLSAAEIGRMYGCTRQAVNKQRRKRLDDCGSVRRRPGNMSDVVPWSVKWEHRNDGLLAKLHDLRRLREGRSVAAPLALRQWMEFMEDAHFPDGTPAGPVVVVYDRDTPEGFFLEPAWPDELRPRVYARRAA